MANRGDTTRSDKQSPKPVRAAKSGPVERYPDWKVQLFRAGMAERRNSAAQISGRAMRAPGA